MRYIVTAEQVYTHRAVVEAVNVDDAAEKYLDIEWVKDLGDTFADPEPLVLSVESVGEEVG